MSYSGDTHNFQTESSVMSDSGDTHQIQTESSIMSDSIGSQLFQGKITHIIDPSNFWAQIGTESDTEMFKELEEELKIFCESVGVLNKDSNIGLLDCGCYVLVKQEESWHRAQVSRVDELKQRLDVSYLDHGDTDIVHMNHICVACPRIFYSLKPQAFKCQLVGIKPLAKNWTNRGIKCFKDRTKDQIFQTAIVSIDQQFMFTGVSLYYSDDQGRSLAYDLIDEEIGMPSDVNVPEFARDVRSALPESYLENFQYDADDQSTLTSDNYSPLPFDQSVASNSTDPSNPSSAVNSPAEFCNPSNPETFNIDISNIGSTQSVQKDLENKVSAKPENYINNHNYLNVTNGRVDDKSDRTPRKDNQNNVDTTCEHRSGAVTPCSNQSNPTSPEVKTPTHRKLYTDSWSDPQTPTSGTEPPSPDLGIPGFNLSAIMKTKSVCAGDLQEERDVHRRVTTKTEIVDNMEQIYDEIEYNNDCSNTLWDMSDLNISVDSGQQHDVIDNIKSQIDAILPKQQYIHTGWENSHRQPDAFPTTTNVARVEQDFFPVLKIENSEEAEYKLSKQLAKLIKNIANEDPVIVCDRIHQVVPPDGSCEANVLSVCLEMLIDEAMSNKAAQDAILKILDSYSHCDIFGACIESVVKKLTRSYIKRPIRRTVHTDFSHILAQLFLMSKYWPLGVASLVQDFIISTLWKWIIFNKSGQQVGREAMESCELYLSCLETVWSTLSTVIYELYPDKHKSFLKDLLDKLLGDKITSNVRTRLFNLYMVSKEDIIKTTESTHSNGTSADSNITKTQLKSDASSQTSPCLQDTKSTNTDDLDIKDWMKESLSTYEVPCQAEEENKVSSSYFDFHDDQFDFGNGGYQDERILDQSSCFDHHDDDIWYGDNNNCKHEIIDKRVEAVTIKRVISFSDIRKNEKYHGKSGNESDSSIFSVNSATQEPIKSEETNKNSNRMDVESVSSEVPNSKTFSHSEVNNNNQRDTDSLLPSYFNTKGNSTKMPEKQELPVKKKHKKTSPKQKQYHSWAECVKLEKSSSENLQADHLKHLAMQTLQSGVLKGKNIKARRQLSTEELKVMSSKESRSKPVTKSNLEHCKDSRESKPISLNNDINNIKTLNKDPEPVLSKHKAGMVPEGKFLQPKRAQEVKRPETFAAKSRRLLKGKDLPMKAKLTREMLEEQLEKEVMMKFAPKSAYAMSSHKTPVKPKPKTNPETEWPSLKPKVSPPQKTKDTTSSNSLQSIAAALLETPTATEVGSVEEKHTSCTSNKIKITNPSEQVKGGDSTVPMINNSDSSSDVKGEETNTSRSYFDDSDDEWESDDSQDNFMVSGPTDKFQMDANKAPTYQPVQRTWNPGVRTCSSCGETTHVVYDCPKKASIIF